MPITIYGASDDLIEIEGEIREEFDSYQGCADNHGQHLACSDGTLLSVLYDQDGCWRFHRVTAGSADFAKTEGDPDGDYTDRVTLTGDIRWVALVSQIARKG